ncbi:uncharacterized protein FFFS_10893 [Fusarium fujikuroi]|nr:uncharacterized protein FFFS_10893 [Fusarium fujikuroi]
MREAVLVNKLSARLGTGAYNAKNKNMTPSAFSWD